MKFSFQQSSTSTCFVCEEHNEFIVRRCQGKSVILQSQFEKKKTEKLQTTSIINVKLLQRKFNFSPINLPTNLKEKESLIFEYESDISGNKLTKNFLQMPNLKSASNKNPFGLEISREQVVNQTVHLLRKIVLEKDSEKVQATHFSTVSKYLRMLSLEDLTKMILPLQDSLSEESVLEIKDLFYNVVSLTGTNPAAMLIKNNIEIGLLSGESATKPLFEMIRSVKTPTKELLSELIELVKTLKSLESESKDLHNIGLVELSKLLMRACVHPARSVAEFPVKVFGQFCSKNSQLITQNWIPYLESELNSALNEEEPNEKEAKILINSLGNLGHINAVKPLIKIIDKKYENTSPILRSFAVYNLKQSSVLHPSLLRPTLMSLIENKAENIQVRAAAVSTLPWSNPSQTDLLKIATQTWQEPSQQV